MHVRRMFAALVVVAACEEEDPPRADQARPFGEQEDPRAGVAAVPDASAPTTDAGEAGDIPGGGRVLFRESFDDPHFASRAWYDHTAGAAAISTDRAKGAGSFACVFAAGTTACKGGTPGRHKFEPTETLYFSFYVKLSASWVGSGRAYHPHVLHFLTDVDGDYVGYANTHLTTYTEIVWDTAAGSGKALLGLQDTLNVDPKCVLLNNGAHVGCAGNPATYAFTENRSVCSCNGLQGDLDVRDCFSIGGGSYYSFRGTSAPSAFTNVSGPRAKNDWHFVEVYFQMNSIDKGVGVPDGRMRWVQDGVTLIKRDRVLFRTGAHPTMRFVQHGFAPYIGDGSPVAQTLWIDELTVATARP